MSEPLVGMYAVRDPKYPQVKIGNFTICRVEAAISEMYRKYF